MANRKAKNATIDYSGDNRQSIFGWCCTGHHKDCVIEFVGHACICECHTKGFNPDVSKATVKTRKVAKKEREANEPNL